jgi:hypothetical protein
MCLPCQQSTACPTIARSVLSRKVVHVAVLCHICWASVVMQTADHKLHAAAYHSHLHLYAMPQACAPQARWSGAGCTPHSNSLSSHTTTQTQQQQPTWPRSWRRRSSRL